MLHFSVFSFKKSLNNQTFFVNPVVEPTLPYKTMAYLYNIGITWKVNLKFESKRKYIIWIYLWFASVKACSVLPCNLEGVVSTTTVRSVNTILR